jgi:hypothetical protein
MTRLPLKSLALASLALGTVVSFSSPISAEDRIEMANANYNKRAHAQTYAPRSNRATYSSGEILSSGHNFFGGTTSGLAQAVEYVFQKAGPPQGYIIGQEGAGAFIGGLRYGEGMLYLKDGTRQKVFWQGPSIGFDFGGNGSRTLVLVYNIDNTADIFDRFIGLDGSAYLIGGLGVNFQSNEKLRLAPIRTGVGARLGANVGYLKYTAAPTWNPF